jgi:hypothetical protein
MQLSSWQLNLICSKQLLSVISHICLRALNLMHLIISLLSLLRRFKGVRTYNAPAAAEDFLCPPHSMQVRMKSAFAFVHHTPGGGGVGGGGGHTQLICLAPPPADGDARMKFKMFLQKTRTTQQ